MNLSKNQKVILLIGTFSLIFLLLFSPRLDIKTDYIPKNEEMAQQAEKIRNDPDASIFDAHRYEIENFERVRSNNIKFFTLFNGNKLEYQQYIKILIPVSISIFLLTSVLLVISNKKVDNKKDNPKD